MSNAKLNLSSLRNSSRSREPSSFSTPWTNWSKSSCCWTSPQRPVSATDRSCSFSLLAMIIARNTQSCAIHGDHAVRRGALVEDAVALVEVFLVLADAHAHRALHDEVKFLAGVRRGVDGLALQLLGILIGDPIGRGQLLPEHCRHILNGDAVLAGRHRAHAPARHRVARELGRLALEQIRQLHAERQRALVHERKREIDRAGLIASVFCSTLTSVFSAISASV